MSYCRWSEGDVYAYEAAEGYVTHVAAYRTGPDGNKMRIGLCCDGASFIDKSLMMLRVRLRALRDIGYILPDRAIDEIDRELAEEKAT